MSSAMLPLLLVAAAACVAPLASAGNYDAYLAGIEKRNRDLHTGRQLVEPAGAGFLDRLDGHISDLQARHYVSDSAYPSDFDADRYWQELLERSNAELAEQQPPPPLPMSSLDDAEEDVMYDGQPDRRSSEYDEAAARLLTAAASRREEEPFLNRVWGEHKVSGGAGEPGQVTGPENRPQQQKVLSSDTLPSYCDPPNPCPVGVDPSTLTSPCDSSVPDTAKYNKADAMRKMAAGQCPCDNEHMECPAGAAGVASKKSVPGHPNPYLKGNKRDKLDAKKSPRYSVSKRGVRAKFHSQVMEKKNPWLDGVEALDTVEKKAGQRLHLVDQSDE